ncbi:uncharacterized protein LOC116614708 [Nematostella vectensis]|uniref:uncharacterized protein LOC116614708 n=1 Tax=Nematostella vectensis TaxID=45351 RepID=UPI0020778D5F|nr:uncharacterized protein LOC116614708 [Nematostella vectensis]XP_048576788.1 uncharacterized protein LOC116614708 [Nematostella vectensis]
MTMAERFFIIDWETAGKKFLENISLTPQVQFNVHIFVYYSSPEMPAKLLPQYRALHVPRNAKICALKDADWEPLVRKASWRSRRAQNPAKNDVCLVSGDARGRFGELMNILTSSHIEFRVISTENQSILQEFDIKCVKCRMVFATRGGLEKHNQKFCGYFDECLTNSSKKLTGYTERSVANSRNCPTCMENCIVTFCHHGNRSEEMDIVHKSQFVGKTHSCWSSFDTNTYTSHFLYGYDSLPCLAVTGCQRSFSSVQEQAHHHVTEHGSRKPYFCMVCYRVLKIVCFENESELLLHGKLEGHCEPEFSFA